MKTYNARVINQITKMVDASGELYLKDPIIQKKLDLAERSELAKRGFICKHDTTTRLVNHIYHKDSPFSIALKRDEIEKLESKETERKLELKGIERRLEELRKQSNCWKYSFDDYAIGEISATGSSLKTRLVAKPSSCKKAEWYVFAGEITKLLNDKGI